MSKLKKLMAADVTRLEELETVVESIQAGVRKIRDTGLNDKVLFMLIQHAAPTVPGNRVSRRKLRLHEIEATLDGLENLANYMFGSGEEPA